MNLVVLALTLLSAALRAPQTSPADALLAKEAVAQALRAYAADDRAEFDAARARLAAEESRWVREGLALLARHLEGEQVGEAPWADTLLQAASEDLNAGQLARAGAWLDVLELRLDRGGFHEYYSVGLRCELAVLGGRFGDASVLGDRLEQLFETCDFGERYQESLVFLAGRLYKLGRFARTRQLWSEAEASGDLKALRVLLVDRANLRYHERDWKGVVADSTRLLALEEADEDDRLRATYQRARGRRRLGDLAGAEEDFIRVFGDAAAPRQLPPAALSGLAMVAYERGDLDVALETIERALESMRQAELVDYEMDGLYSLALIQLARGDATEARAALGKAQALIETSQVLDLGPQRAAEQRSRFFELSSVAQDVIAYEWRALRSRALATDNERALTASRERLVSDGLGYAARWAGRSVASSLGVDRKAQSTLKDPLAAVRAALPAGAQFVQFVAGRQALYAYVIAQERATLHTLGNAGGIRDAVDEFARVVLGRDASADVGAVARLGFGLYERLLEPLSLELADAERQLYIVPTPELASLPFEALVTRVAKEDVVSFAELSFVLDETSIAYLPTSLMFALLDPPPSADAGRPLSRAVLLGDALHADELGQRPKYGSPVERLKASRDEVLGIASILVLESEPESDFARWALRAGRSDERSLSWGTQLRVCTGTQARCGALEFGGSADAVVDLLHFATHSAEEPLNPTSAALVLSPDGDDDGYLTVGRIRKLGLRAHTVVLSACSSAVGPLVPGDGVQSLAGAFFENGAQEVVATLSGVLDEATSELMLAFYEARVRGATTRAALDAARRERRHTEASYRGVGVRRSARMGVDAPGHPRNWAPFIYLGR